MKTRVISKILGLCALLLSIFIPAADLEAQIVNPYPITNNLGCSVRIRYEIFRQPNNCTVLCAANTIVIPAGAIVNIPVPPPPCGCRIRICIIDVGGVVLPAPICGSWPPPAPPVCGPTPIATCSSTGLICLDVQPVGAMITP